MLTIQFLESSLSVYNEAKDRCTRFLTSIINKNFKKILFYGAGEVAEIMVNVINNTPSLALTVLAIIDDDEEKIGTNLINIPIISLSEIKTFDYDGILVSSYGHSKAISNKLNEANSDKSKIIKFFES